MRSGAVSPPFIRRGFDGRDVVSGPVAVWPRGSTQEVAFSIFSNKVPGRDAERTRVCVARCVAPI